MEIVTENMSGDSIPAEATAQTARRPYAGTDLAFLIPTKDRPESIEILLASLVRQTIACGRVIVVDGGESIEKLVTGYRDRLPAEYYACRPPGQIRQRNLGIRKLDDRTLLVGLLDDELVLDPDALEKMIRFWNEIDTGTAGVGFNIIDAPPYRASWFGRLFLMNAPEPGRVLRSGYNSRIDNVDTNIRTQWLGGGYTVWKREILRKYPQQDLATRWAIGEDLRFSYPVGKIYPLYVCASAKVRHPSVVDQASERSVHRYRGRKASLAYYYFVASHPELSRIACLWMLAGRFLGQFFLGCAQLDNSLLQNSFGQAGAIWVCAKSALGLADLRAALED